MAESVFGLISVNTNSLENRYHEGDNMPGEVEVTEPPEIQIAEEGHQVIGCGAPQNAMVTPEPLVLLIEATQVDGSSLPLGTFMVRSVAYQILGLTGRNPVDIEVINDRNVIVQKEPELGVVPVAQALHTINKWEGFAAEITCLMTSHKNMVGIIKEWDDSHHRLQQHEQDVMKLQQEQKESQEQMVEILQKFWEEVKKVEEMRTHMTPSTPVKQEVAKMEMTTEDKQLIPQASSRDECKIEKPPQICIFSGSDPIPKDEGSYEQWEFQVRGAMATHTKNSVCAAIVNSL